MVSNTLNADAPRKQGFMIPIQMFKGDLHTKFLLLVRELLRNPKCAHFLITQSVVNNYPHFFTPSLQKFVMWYGNHFTLSRSPCRWNWPWWLCLPGLVSGHQPNFLERKRAIHFFTDLPDTQSVCTVSIWRWTAASLVPSAVRNWITAYCSSTPSYSHMHYSVNWTAPSALSCSCGCPRILQSTMKIPIASLDVWLRSLIMV